MKKACFAILACLPAILFSQNTAPDTTRQHWHDAAAPDPTSQLNQLKIRVFDFSMKRTPGLPVTVQQLESGKVWLGTTGAKGEVYFLVPKGRGYRIDVADEQGLKTVRLPPSGNTRSSFAVTYVAQEYTETERNDTISQVVSAAQAPTRSRVVLKMQVRNFDEEPLVGEVLFFSAKKSGKVYLATANDAGLATLMLPKGDTFCLSTSYVADVDCFELEQNDFAERMGLTYHTIGTQEFLRRKAERERLAAVRDSLYRLRLAADSLRMLSDSLQGQFAERDFLHQLKFGKDLAELEKLVRQRAKKEEKLLAQDPKYFENAGEEIKAALFRNRDAWAQKVIVTDITGSMYPYMDQVLLWHALQLTQTENNQYVFFNDGDSIPDNHDALGHAGGIYRTDASEMQQLLKTIHRGMLGGVGGSGPENDLEALLAGTQQMRKSDELILIADNYSDVWDLELLAKLDVPVHVILAGADEGGVNEQYLEIAYRTGGSIHTLRQDIDGLAKLADGQTIEIAGYQYRVSKGKFLQVTRL